MPKTRDEVVTLAHRSLGVLAVDEVLTADQITFGGDVLVGLIDEIDATQGLSLSFDADSVPEAMYLPVAYLLAVELAPHYSIPPAYSRAAQIGKIRAYELSDDRDDRRDIDDNGTVSDAEAYVDGQAAFY
jgi:hypothetical protein